VSRLGGGADLVLAAALDRLIPADEHGPGALGAGVQRYIEGSLERSGAAEAARWRGELEALDARARAREGAAFAELAPAAADRMLEQSPLFEDLRARAIEGMFCDPLWGGNAGEAGWRLLGYPGPRHVWGAADQRIDERTQPS
jgi:gluconate 2-dehydrogenase gamma chain